MLFTNESVKNVCGGLVNAVLKDLPSKSDFEQFQANIEHNMKRLFDKSTSYNMEDRFVKLETEYKCELSKRDTKIENLEKQIEQIRHQQSVSEWRREILVRRIDDGDQSHRRLNLKLSGIPVKRTETPTSIRDAVLDEIERLDFQIDDAELDRAHRNGPVYFANGQPKQEVLCRFISWYPCDQFYSSRKESRFYVKADLTEHKS